jgi:hypothetical protein
VKRTNANGFLSESVLGINKPKRDFPDMNTDSRSAGVDRANGFAWQERRKPAAEIKPAVSKPS